MSILSLSLFQTFVEFKDLMVVNAHMMSSSDWNWYRCMVLKIVISFKNSFPTVCCWKKKELLLPVDTDQRDLVTLSGHPLEIESDSTAADFAAQSGVQQCNLLHSEPAALAHQKGFAPSKCFWCNCQKGYIYPSWRDVVRRSRKIWRMQRKSISTSLQMRLMLKTQISFHFQIDVSTIVFYF